MCAERMQECEGNVLQNGESAKVPALSLGDALRRRFGEQIPVPENLRFTDALASLNERSVCRDYRSDPLPEQLVHLLCATALSSPSKSDLQQATIIRVSSQTKRARIQDLISSSPWIAAAPELLVVCGDHSRLRLIFEQRSSEFPNDHLDAFFNAAVDAGIVLSTMLHAAQLLGLGACPVSEIRDHIRAISELLELPQWVFPVVAVTVGYPHALEPFSPRLGLQATLHTDRYDPATAAPSLFEYDTRRMRDRPYRVQRDIGRFGEAARYGWTEEKFRQYSVEQRADFGEYIRAKGFRLD